MVKIAICDDDAYICSEIEKVIFDFGKTSTVEMEIEVFYSGEELIHFMEKEYSFDLVFLDIELGETTGIEVGSKIRNEFDNYISKIVFITSKDGYEQKLFDVQPLNFIKKPLDHEKIERCLRLAIKLFGLDNQIFEYKKGYDVVRVDAKDILYFESRRKKIRIVTNRGEDWFYGTLEGIREKLSPMFVEPHGSFLVNFDKIERITRESAFMKNGVEIPISQRNLKNIRSMLIDVEKEKHNARV
ncbi:MAG: LytR/AlgR family response regulator transcription factor [Acetivibrio ethanolgignens]